MEADAPEWIDGYSFMESTFRRDDLPKTEGVGLTVETAMNEEMLIDLQAIAGNLFRFDLIVNI
ncbi:MAG: hypothetical protein ABII68_04185 [Pseudomonadota bacterium]